MEGRELWRRDFGQLEHEWGYGASPVIDGSRVIVNFGPGARSFLGAFDLKSGQPLWRVNIPEERPRDRTDGFQGREAEGVVGTWATPIIVETSGRREIVFPFNSRLRGFDLDAGRELWTCGGLTPLFYASPVSDSSGMVFLASGYRGNALTVQAGGSGDVTAARRLWHEVGAKSGIGSGVVYEGKIYYHAGSIGICRDLKTGAVHWEERLRGAESNVDSWSSLLRAGDKLYVPNQSGDVIIFRASPKFELIAVNSIGGERCNASLAAADGRLFLRTHKHLWCLGK
jgi:outer membrane protein assembly factor BamB